MIGEFCPKVFALTIDLRFQLKTKVVEFGAEASAGIVIRPLMPALSTGENGPPLGRWTIHLSSCFL
jgi:hypothetical protein